jgi:serine/threonine-protein kinase
LHNAVAACLEALEAHPDLGPELADFLAGREQLQRLASGPDPRDTAAATSGETPAPMPLPPRWFFEDYELLGEVARGGMGVVYKVRQIGLDRVVALKAIGAGRLASAEDVQRFQAEARAVARLEHPHIVPVFEVGERQGQHYFTMPLLAGGSLADRLPELRDNPREAARLVAVVARAVHHAHRHGILHRDLKPANILLDARGEPHVSDFGLAKLMEEPTDTPTAAVVGTPGFMAPEQAVGKSGLTTAADVYGLGAILYALLAGRPPFQGTSWLDTLRQVRDLEPEPVRRHSPNAPRDLETVCLKCLAKDPARRYPSAEALADDLERWLCGEPIHARPVGWRERAWKWARRRPAAAGLVATVAAVVVLVLPTLVGLYLHAEERRRAADDANQKAQAELAATRRYFAVAVQAVKECFIVVSERPELHRDGMQPVRAAVLRPALRYFQKFIEEQPDDPALQVELAWSYFGVGCIECELGDQRKSRTAFEKARDAWEDQHRQKPGDLEGEYRLALTCLNLAQVQRQTGQVAAAWKTNEQATTRLRSLVGRPGANARCPSLLGHALLLAAPMQAETGQRQAAVQSLQEAVAMQTKLCAQEPGNFNYGRDLGNALVTLGHQHLLGGRHDEAGRCLSHGCELLEELVSGNGDRRDLRVRLAEACTGLGRVRQETDGPRSAVRWFVRGRNLYTELHGNNPAVPRYQVGLATNLANLGQAQVHLGELTKGLRTLDDALARFDRLAADGVESLDTTRVHALALMISGQALRKSGKPAEALSRLEQGRALLGKLLADNARVTALRADVAAGWEETAAAHLVTGKPALALQACAEARRLREDLLKDTPEDFRCRLGLASAQVYQAAAQLLAGEAEGFATCSKQAEDVLEKLAKEVPDAPPRARVAELCQLLGVQFNNAGRPAQAARCYERARALQHGLVRANPDVVSYQEGLGVTRAGLGFIHLETGRPGPALDLLRQARADLERLCAAHPDTLAGRLALVRVYGTLGFLHHDAGKLDEARDLDERAHALAAQLVQKYPGLPAYQRELALSCYLLGTHCQERGDLRQALVWYRKEQAIFQSLAEKTPRDPNTRHGLAGSLRSLAGIYWETRQLPEALHTYRQTYARYKDLVEEYPTLTAYQGMLAAVARDLGLAEETAGRLEPAGRLYEEAKTRLERLVAQEPESEERQRLLAKACINLGLVRHKTGRPAEARRLFDDARARLKKLVAANPADTACRKDLAWGLTALGSLHIAGKEFAAAQAAYDEALALRQALARDNPELASAQANLAAVHVCLANLKALSGRRAEALPRYRDALAIQEKLVTRFPEADEFRQTLALILYNLGAQHCEMGQPAEALPVLERSLHLRKELLAKRPDNPTQQYDAGLSVSALADVRRQLRRKRPVRRRLAGSDTIGAFLFTREPHRCPAPPPITQSPSRSGATLSIAGGTPARRSPPSARPTASARPPCTPGDTDSPPAAQRRPHRRRPPRCSLPSVSSPRPPQKSYSRAGWSFASRSALTRRPSPRWSPPSGVRRAEPRADRPDLGLPPAAGRT